MIEIQPRCSQTCVSTQDLVYLHISDDPICNVFKQPTGRSVGLLHDIPPLNHSFQHNRRIGAYGSYLLAMSINPTPVRISITAERDVISSSEREPDEIVSYKTLNHASLYHAPE